MARVPSATSLKWPVFDFEKAMLVGSTLYGKFCVLGRQSGPLDLLIDNLREPVPALP